MNGDIVGRNVLVGKLSSDSSLIAKLDYIPTSTTTYEGSYTVSSGINEQVLETSNKLMTDNLTITGISYIEENNDYGKTVYIGSDTNGD